MMILFLATLLVATMADGRRALGSDQDEEVQVGTYGHDMEETVGGKYNTYSEASYLKYGYNDGLLEQRWKGYYDDNLDFFNTATKDPQFNAKRAMYITMGLAGYETDQYSYSWTGYFCPTETGTYKFQTTSDDASHILISGETILDNGGIHSKISKTGTWIAEDTSCKPIAIYYGQYAYYGQVGAGAWMKFSFQKPSNSFFQYNMDSWTGFFIENPRPTESTASSADAPAAAVEPEEEEEEESSAAADQYCVVKDSALVGVYSSADEAKSAMVSFSGNTQRATFVVSNGVLNTDPHKVADSQGNLQKDGGTWNRLWWDWNSINAMAAVAQGSSECTTGTAQETRVGQDIEQRVKEVIADQLGFDASEIRLDDKPLEDLGGTDWDMGCPMCEIWMTLEEEFNDGYPFEGDYETEAVTVQDMIDVVENAQKGLKREVNVGSNEVKNQDMSLSIQVPRPSDYVLLPLACVGVFSMVCVALGKCGFQDKTYKGVQAEVEDV